MGMPYLFPIVQMILQKEKVVIAAHNVKTPKGARYYWLAKPYMEYVVRTFNRFQVFSKNQYDLLTSINRKAKVLYAPLCLKNYGKPTIEKPREPVNFLFFGNIVEYKRLDILLNAVNSLCAKGVCGFRIRIYGYCRPTKWKESYLPLIHNSEVVETDIRRIPNEDIPNLFQSSHYFVMPYQDIAQSGAMTVALQYNLPIIASNLEVFKEFMNGKDDGYFFEPGSAERLADVMEEVINNHAERYEKMRDNQARFVIETLSTEVIVSKYKDYFNQLCHN
jgi:glycosyltransferase involved in cell wall biosynthesis